MLTAQQPRSHNPVKAAPRSTRSGFLPLLELIDRTDTTTTAGTNYALPRGLFVGDELQLPATGRRLLTARDQG